MFEGIFGVEPMNWANVYYYTLVFIYSIIFSGVIAYMVYWIKFKYRVIVHDRRGEKNAIITIDRGKIFRLKDGTMKLKLWLFKKTVDSPSNKYIYQNGFGLLRKGVIHIYFYGTDSYTFLEENITDKKLVPIDSNIADNARRAREMREKYQNPSLVEKYGAMIMTFFVFLILVGSMIYGVSTNKAIAESNANAAANIAKSVERIVNGGNAPGNAEQAPSSGTQQVAGVSNGFGLLG